MSCRKRDYDVLRMTRKGGKRDVLAIHSETVERLHTVTLGNGAELEDV
jgi:hypothetical protein